MAATDELADLAWEGHEARLAEVDRDRMKRLPKQRLVTKTETGPPSPPRPARLRTCQCERPIRDEGCCFKCGRPMPIKPGRPPTQAATSDCA
jgi:hypothetical protein